MKKRLFSVFICLCMVVFTFPVTAFAQDVDELLADPVCTCATLCTEGEVDENCPVCSAENADLSACTGEAPADPVCTCESSVPKMRWIKPAPSAQRRAWTYLPARERRPQTRCAPARRSVPRMRWIKPAPSARRTVRRNQIQRGCSHSEYAL